jgi:hypothetical protein
MLTYRSRFPRKITKSINNTIYSILKEMPISPEMKHVMFPRLDSAVEKEREYMLRKLRVCGRLYEIGNRVGIIGLVFGEWIPHEVTARCSGEEFEEFLTFFQDQRSWLCEKLDIHWPDSPALFKQVGGIVLVL